jgi:type IV pilus assembly protein PilV
MKAFRQSGFALVEVLISVFVLAAGILGNLSLQLTALRLSQHAAFQTAAANIASSIADSLRANDGRTAFSGADSPYLDIDYRAASGSAAAGGVECYVSRCSPEHLAAFEIEEWKSRIRTELPGGRLRVCRDARPWNETESAYRWQCAPAEGQAVPTVIKIGWQDRRGTAEQAPPAVVIAVEPRTW